MHNPWASNKFPLWKGSIIAYLYIMRKNGLCPSFVYYIKQIDTQQDISFYFPHLNAHNLCHTMNELRCLKKS